MYAVRGTPQNNISRPVIANIKLSFRLISGEILSYLFIQANKVTSTYLIYKDPIYNFTLTIYYQSKKNKIINITGIRDLDILPCIFKYIRRFFNHPSIFGPFKVDNITASGRCSNLINFSLLSQCANLKGGFKFNSSLFPGGFIKLNNGKRIIIFKSGKYISVGCKSQSEINDSYSLLKEIIDLYNERNL